MFDTKKVMQCVGMEFSIKTNASLTQKLDLPIAFGGIAIGGGGGGAVPFTPFGGGMSLGGGGGGAVPFGGVGAVPAALGGFAIVALPAALG